MTNLPKSFHNFGYQWTHSPPSETPAGRGEGMDLCSHLTLQKGPTAGKWWWWWGLCCALSFLVSSLSLMLFMCCSFQ